MDPTFNLVDEPWIPCVSTNNAVRNLSLRQTLKEAHSLRGIAGASPLITGALYRLLLAVLYRIVESPQDPGTWADLWEAGRFPPDCIDAYLDRWREQFDLFHPQQPFYQGDHPRSRVKPLSALIPEAASGNNATLFDHNTDTLERAFNPADAAQILLACQTFSVAGGSGLAPKEATAAPWAGAVIFLCEGDSLFETLLLNLLPCDSEYPIPGDPTQDRPVWEAPDPYLPERTAPLGYLDYLTWPGRVLRLLPEHLDGQLVVRQVALAGGLRLSSPIWDPFKHYSGNDKQGWRPLRFRQGRALWRDSAAFLRIRDPENARPPALFDWLAELIEDEVLPRSHSYRLMALGACSNQAKIDFYREEHLPLPMDYLMRPELIEDLALALQAAENVRNALMRAVSRLATLVLSPTADQKDGRQPDRKDRDNLMAHWAVDPYYWASLEVPFIELLVSLPQKGEDALQTWQDILFDTARAALTRAEMLAGTDIRALRAAVRARGQLEGALKKLTDEQ